MIGVSPERLHALAYGLARTCYPGFRVGVYMPGQHVQFKAPDDTIVLSIYEASWENEGVAVQHMHDAAACWIATQATRNLAQRGIRANADAHLARSWEFLSRDGRHAATIQAPGLVCDDSRLRIRLGAGREHVIIPKPCLAIIVTRIVAAAVEAVQ